ncbi:hypothetical protein BCR36DRAFT_255033, partial [Piromyces finnis]
ERKYSTFDRELLALSETLLHYKLLLQQGQKIYCATDHKNLVIYINSGSKVETNRKLQNIDEKENIDFNVFKATTESLLQANKQIELKEYLFKWYQNQDTLFKNLKEQVVNLLKENTYLEEQYRKQIETKRKLEKLNQKINDLRYDLNPKAERIELTKKVNKTEKQLGEL